MNRMLAVALAAALVLAATCAAPEQGPVREAIATFLDGFMENEMYRVKNTAVWEKLDGDAADFTVVDVRPPERYENGRVPGSVNIPLPTLLDNLGKVPMDRTTYVYCDLDQNAAFGVMALRELGYDARVMADGWGGWQDAGYPAEPAGETGE